MAATATNTLGEMAVAMPGAARVFSQMGIDFCCGGKKSLDQACSEKGLEVKSVLKAISDLTAKGEANAPDHHWQHESLQHLMQHVVSRHHQYARSETPHIELWLEKCIAAHGSRHPELREIRHTFAAMVAEMAQHMAKEELILFPGIARAETGQAGGSLAAPVRMMISEHDHTGRDLDDIRKLSGDFALPPDACSTYHALYKALAAFEDDMRQHVHLENNILFPRALALAAKTPDVDPSH